MYQSCMKVLVCESSLLYIQADHIGWIQRRLGLSTYRGVYRPQRHAFGWRQPELETTTSAGLLALALKVHVDNKTFTFLSQNE